ncbi:type I restriction-modification system methyltransferase subunit [Desulfitobacterium dehalogenans ATCC 51507]|uniref:site-specific DNA-methyltransferase (adenine-specific) n=1 Tax=Desulfitobacterium dehalogenans (strain ATCC 51507 / DSM 9161 / JW/IU-DC1) TaxID=756499 RepID=I4A932_DESDJ|nr:TaqI-like C-terminal specificity domain-containing protein [Desulfitobacterium dehalogenans]AFM00467.1 type I restriction-modification system methyltransferase subunit [Desulfitobacterium dehalogenans ATCC 51507]
MDFLTREDCFELNEVCDLLSISKATAINWIKNSTLKPIDIKGNKNLFLKKDIEALLFDIKRGNNSKLKSRRNKNYISGTYIPKTYIQSKEGIEVVGKIISCLDSIDLAEGYERVILAEYALKLLTSRKMISFEPKRTDSTCFLRYYLKDARFAGRYSVLIDDLLGDIKDIELQLVKLSPALNFYIDYINEQDFLGLLSMSLQNLEERKSKGVYYTPLTVVKDTVDWLKPMLHKDIKILDPCCGTGNFLMYAYKYIKNLEGLHGYDISPLSVSLTRINMALLTKTADVELLYRNFLCANPLLGKLAGKFDVVIGNPPWGFKYSPGEQKELKKLYPSARATTVESFCVFAEFGLRSVVNKGVVSLILPQSLLQVKIHRPIRKYLMNACQIKRIRYWEDAFDGVQCPAMTLTYQKNAEEFSVKGAQIVSRQKVFTIAKERTVDIDLWNFDLTDAEVRLIERLKSSVDVTYLKHNADFALGIVTGDNRKFLSNKITHEEIDDESDIFEFIYRGSDVFKYKCLPAQYKIKFHPHKFQQVAPIELYRAKEKLIYRFIGGCLVFAYDDTQALTLNSANILIPKIEGLSIKYILAVLNSRIAQYFYSRQFKSLKVLRSQIESIPIPLINKRQQYHIVTKVESLLKSCDPGEVNSLYNAIDRQVKDIFGLTDPEYEYIKQELMNTKLFLWK